MFPLMDNIEKRFKKRDLMKKYPILLYETSHLEFDLLFINVMENYIKSLKDFTDYLRYQHNSIIRPITVSDEFELPVV